MGHAGLRGFVLAYGAYSQGASQQATVDDFQGANVSPRILTIGTVQSVPRPMPGQGVIVGVVY